jgi:hypothetical protein
MDLALWLAPCRKRSKLAHSGAIENCLGHDGTSRISGAKEQHIVWVYAGVTHVISSVALPFLS